MNLNDGIITLDYAGKTKSSRRVIMRQSAINALRRVQPRRLAHLEPNQAIDPNDSVLALPDGTAVKSLKKGFRELLRACGFEYRKRPFCPTLPGAS